MISDLQQDLQQMNYALSELKTFKLGLDSLARAICIRYMNDSVMLKLYDLNLRYLRLVPVTFSDRTSSQLKNSGSMRLIRNKKVADSILNYWQQIDYFNYVSPRQENFRIKARELSFKIFDYTAYNVDKGFNQYYFVNKHPEFLPGGKELLMEYTNFILAGKASLGLYYYPPLLRLNSQAQHLIDLIKKEYPED
jgi:hypothetical protein